MEKNKHELEPTVFQKGEMVVLKESYFAGIRKTLNYVIGSDNKQAWIYVQDELGGDFAIDIPPKEEMPEGRSVDYYWTHCMLFGPQTKGRGNLYSSPEPWT